MRQQQRTSTICLVTWKFDYRKTRDSGSPFISRQQDTIDGMGRCNIGGRSQRADNRSERDAWNHQCPPTMSDHHGARDPKGVLILFAYPTCLLRRNDTSTSSAKRYQPQIAAQFEVSIDSLYFTRLIEVSLILRKFCNKIDRGY